MEGIKPTRVNDGADRRDGWRGGHGVTPTYHGELGYGQGEGGLGGKVGVDVLRAEKRQKAGFSSFTAEKRG